jgi:hypothetical protein
VGDKNSNQENNKVGTLTSSVLSAMMFISLSVYGVASAQPQEPKATVDCGNMILTRLIAH